MTSKNFGALTTATEAATAFSREIRGETIVITGISPSSLGEALALSLSAQSPRLLILASRTPAKLSLVTSKIHTSFPDVRVQEIIVDLASQRSVRQAAAEIKKMVGDGGIGIFFNNAGINISERQLTPEGIEMQFGTNHIGPFLLTNLLLPLILRTGKGRVVMTSSEAHRISPVRFSDFNLEGKKIPRDEEPRRGLPVGMLRGDGGYEPAVAYGQSKTANVLFAVALNERLGGRGLKSFAVHPGTIMTELTRDLDGKTVQDLLATIEVWKTADQGAATLVVAAFDPKLSSENGVFLDDCQMKRPSKWASDIGKAERLWHLSELLVDEKFDYGRTSRL